MKLLDINLTTEQLSKAVLITELVVIVVVAIVMVVVSRKLLREQDREIERLKAWSKK
ncbi:hypothetical protein [Belliella pelovolcani]|uniref:hypothetical protein n=1 Tax=Belliella pelovolcani TaxID=529505 RepID=UPI00391C091B